MFGSQAMNYEPPFDVSLVHRNCGNDDGDSSSLLASSDIIIYFSRDNDLAAYTYDVTSTLYDEQGTSVPVYILFIYFQTHNFKVQW